MRKYQIQGITDINGKSREDGRYPQRINSIVNIFNLNIGEPMAFEYITDGKGNPKQGYLTTSKVSEKEFVEKDNLLIVTTQNSIYYLFKLND